MEGKTDFSRRLKQFDDWLTLTWLLYFTTDLRHRIKYMFSSWKNMNKKCIYLNITIICTNLRSSCVSSLPFALEALFFCDDVLCKLTFTFTSMKYMNENCCWITLGGSWGVPACPVPKSDRDRASTDLQWTSYVGTDTVLSNRQRQALLRRADHTQAQNRSSM